MAKKSKTLGKTLKIKGKVGNIDRERIMNGKWVERKELERENVTS